MPPAYKFEARNPKFETNSKLKILMIKTKNTHAAFSGHLNFDGLVRSAKASFSVIPAKAGIQEKQAILDPGFRRGDGFDDFLQDHQLWLLGIVSSFVLRISNLVLAS